MIVMRNYHQGIVAGETEKSYRVIPLADKLVWWPKAQCREHHDFYAMQVAMHLWAGYQSEFADPQDTIDDVQKISRFVPVLLAADRKIDMQIIRYNRDDWDKVFLYDVAHPAGVWLANNHPTDIAEFTAYVEELIK